LLKRTCLSPPVLTTAHVGLLFTVGH